ncbi:MAG TPA: deoxyribose-phosphate aldolase [Rariglobus sp.]|jgi:deoxyribose-phosphate aldolase|nr:deoxyribose-phosphate aldolase [Rariglobus sp.]
MTLTPARLAAMLDSTNLRLDASEADIEQLCREAAAYRFACVMIYPASVPLAARILAGTDLRIGTVIGFPSGRFSAEAKAAEITTVHRAGAHEVDIVMNYPALIAGHASAVAAEVATLTRLAHDQGQLIKVIVETCFLNDTQKRTALEICEDAGADFIKTSTGFGTAGAKVPDIAAWAAARRGRIQLKASGGIKTLADARALVEAGATRLGTSSASTIIAALSGAPEQAASSAGY